MKTNQLSKAKCIKTVTKEMNCTLNERSLAAFTFSIFTQENKLMSFKMET